MPKNLVLLFDIDGTLIRCGGAGGQALCAALSDEFSVSDVRPVVLHGRTDLGIANELLERHGLEASVQNRDRLFRRYFEMLPTYLRHKHSLEEAGVLPGVMSLLDWVQGQPSIAGGLMTGNMPVSARIKLQHFSLWGYFEFGVYGDLADHRPNLAGPALSAVATHCGFHLESHAIVVIGDTPLDVELAKAMGAKCLTVSTGGFRSDELMEAGADKVLSDLSDIRQFQDWLSSSL